MNSRADTVDNGNDNAHDYVLRINNISETNPSEVERIVDEALNNGVTISDFLNSRTGLNRVAKDEVIRVFGDDGKKRSGKTTRKGTDFTRTTVVGDGIDHVNVQDSRYTTRPQTNPDIKETSEVNTENRPENNINEREGA